MEPNYKCTQDELYEGCDLLATNMDEELAQLAAFKAKYDAAFVTAFRNSITNATNLPDDDQRVAAHEVLRIKMVKAVDTEVRSALGSLRLYIRDAYDDVDEREVRWREAGFDDYEAAMKYNWEKLKGLLKNANDFINNHNAELSANNNMPATFPPIIATMKTDADTIVTQLLNLPKILSKEHRQKLKQTINLMHRKIPSAKMVSMFSEMTKQNAHNLFGIQLWKL